MKNILLLLALTFSGFVYSQTQTSYSVTSIAAMKTYYGKANKIHVTANNADYVICPGCTADEVLIYAGAGTRKWKISPETLGALNVTDSLRLGKASSVADTTGYDLMVRQRSDGSVFRIRADQFAGFISGGSPLLPTTGTGTAVGAVVGSLAGNTLSVQQGANPFLTIDPTVNSETIILRAYNTTDNGNYAMVAGNTSDTEIETQFEANFNDGVERARIVAFADATSATLTHTADTHIWNGNFSSGGNIEWKLNGHHLSINDVSNGGGLLLISNGTSVDNIDLNSYHATGDGNSTNVGGLSTATDATNNFRAVFNDGVKSAGISAFANSGTSTITHTADTHIINGNFVISTTHTPSSATDTGITGQIAWDSGFIYVCIAANTWLRAAITTWL